MIIYSGTKTDFMTAVENDVLAEEIEKNVYEKMHRNTAKSEFRSWVNSMEYMYKVLNDNDIPVNSGIAIEYNIPQTSKRVDFIISGFDGEKIPHVVIVELKQWENVTPVEGQDAIVETYTGGANRRTVHPSYQAWSYAATISDYNRNVQDMSIMLHPCAYMHNYHKKGNPDKLETNQYKEYVEEAPLFAMGEVSKLREFIKRMVNKGDDGELIYQIDNGRIRPSKSLQDSINSMLKGNKEFIMLDEQKVVYEEVIKTAKQCKSDGKKRTIIIKGGPGTGKTVVAINLLAALTNEDMLVQYTSKNSAPRNVYERKLIGHKKSTVKNMFKGSGSYIGIEPNLIDVVLCDESHRLTARTQLGPKIAGENQIKEIINASLCSVFFIDERQRVTISDIGSIGNIRDWADTLGSEVSEMELLSQFRCNGSDGYLAWVDDVLEIRETANPDLEDIDYDIRIVDSPNEVRDLIFERNKMNNQSRILAGYCWEWIKSGENDTNCHDIKIGDFEMSWNLKNTTTFAIDNDSVNEIGCIHTSQGLDFDYVGVIIGDDMRYENGHIITDASKRARTDKSIFGYKKMLKENAEKARNEADEIIKNTYRTLMTRGMKGCYIYCTDRNLAQYLKERVKKTA